MYVLDTDHVTLDQHGHPLVSDRIRRVGSLRVAISMVTGEEQLHGWPAVIRRASSTEKRVAAYAQLRMAVSYFATFTLLDYTPAADAMVADLRRQGIRIGTQDLRIAAIALLNQVVTRNEHDFHLRPA
jgi:tRNA(fMet)-specific endonuclease VapC